MILHLFSSAKTEQLCGIMTVPFYQVNAFTQDLFKGNIAGVCVLPNPGAASADAAASLATAAAAEAASALLQSVATETNHPATAFISRQGEDFALRWFSPKRELPLCGHGTLAAAHVLREQGWLTPDSPARFHTLGGILTVRLLPGDWIELEFPVFTYAPAVLPDSLAAAFPTIPRQVVFAHDRYLVELESEAAVREYQPDFNKMRDDRVAITALSDPGKPYDFVSRFFAVSLGVYEDAVTGSAHCALAPFWAQRLGKQVMTAYQASARGGTLRVRLEGEKVFIAGQALTVLKGDIAFPTY